MTISFFSNFLNDHQLPFCLELINKIGENNFRFIAHECIAEDRLKMGFEDMNESYSFVVKAYEGGEKEDYAKRLMLTSDVVIIGSSRGMPFEERLRNGKLTFRYNERILKRGDWHLFDPRLFRNVYKCFTQFRSSKYPLYVLCASAYTARDLALFGFPKEKCLKWGYFPLIKEYECLDDMISTKEENSILWVGRLINWKQPKVAVEIARKLKDDGISFSMNIIGTGNECEALLKDIERYQLKNYVHFLGPMTPGKVREYMEKSQIFLFTSNKREGWGAVLNESLGSACVVFANKSIGSVPFVINDNENGFIYNDMDELYCKLKKCFENGEKSLYIARQAYYTMQKLWNARNAVESLMQVIERINKREIPFMPIGPCSNI